MEHSDQTELLLERVEDTLNFYRGTILDLVACRMEGDPGWPALRSLILRAFGDRGLSKRLRTLIFGYANAIQNVDNQLKGDTHGKSK